MFLDFSLLFIIQNIFVKLCLKVLNRSLHFANEANDLSYRMEPQMDCLNISFSTHESQPAASLHYDLSLRPIPSAG